MNSARRLIIACTGGAVAVLLGLAGVMMFTGGGNEPPAPAIPNDPSKPTVPENNDPFLSEEEFLKPANEYRALRIEHQFNQLPGDNTQQRVQKLIDYGFGGVVTNDGWDSQYLLSDRKLQRLDTFLQAAHDAGLRVWIYDEKVYPSGSAGDLVVSANEDYRAVMLQQITVEGSGSGTKSIALPDNFVRFVSASIAPKEDASSITDLNVDVRENGLVFDGREGSWTAYLYCVTAYPVAPDGYNKTYPNLLNAEAVREFIDVTYERYGNAITNFSSVVEAFFDDEPQLCATKNIWNSKEVYPAVPYIDGMMEDFARKYGYELSLPLLFSGTSAQARRTRSNFYEYIGTLLSENFFGQIAGWCEEHGVKFSGHMLLEEQMVYHVPVYGDYLLCAGKMDYPGFDILSPRPAAYIRDMSSGAKYASSTAWLYGKERVFVEICPVIDKEEFASDHLNYALGTMTFAYFDGGNQVGTYYTQANYEQATGVAFNEYIGRLGAMVSPARNKTQVAIYYAVDTVAADYIPPNDQSVYSAGAINRINDTVVFGAVTALRENGLDYVFIDDNAISQASVNGGVLSINDFNFKTIIVPRADIMPIETMRVLDQLAESGANIIFLNMLPSLASREADQAEMEKLTAKHKDLLCPDTEKLPSMVTTTVPLTVKSSNTIYVSPYERNGGEFYFLANAGAEEAVVTLNYKNVSRFRLYDPVTGSITVTEENTCRISGYRALFVQPLFD